jgi:hypothetical protein
MKSYSVDRVGGKDSEMECKCAREEYYAETDKLSFNQLQCDGYGNFNAFQCYENGRECYCVDEDGSRISKVEPTQCLDRFIKLIDTRILKENICKAMRRSLTDMAMTSEKAYFFERETVSVKEESKPDVKKMFDCNKSYI